jgi:uncharacterized protein (DUF58 family)
MKKIITSLLFTCALIGCGRDDRQPSTQVTPVTPSPVWPFTSPGASIKLAKNLITKNYMVVLDESGSMSEAACNDRSKSKDEVAKAAMVEFTNAVPADANLGLVIFDRSGTSIRVPLGTGAANRAAFINAIKTTGPSGGTPLKEAMTLAYNNLVAVAQTQLGYGEYHLVVLTDGAASPFEEPEPVVLASRQTPILIHTMGFCIGTDHSLNRKGVTFYQEAGDLDSIRAGLKSVLAEAPAFDSSFRP